MNADIFPDVTVVPVGASFDQCFYSIGEKEAIGRAFLLSLTYAVFASTFVVLVVRERQRNLCTELLCVIPSISKKRTHTVSLPLRSGVRFCGTSSEDARSNPKQLRMRTVRIWPTFFFYEFCLLFLPKNVSALRKPYNPLIEQEKTHQQRINKLDTVNRNYYQPWHFGKHYPKAFLLTSSVI